MGSAVLVIPGGSREVVRVMRTIAWAALTYASLGVAWGAFGYVMGDPWRLEPLFRDKYLAHLAIVRLHGVGAILALALGPFQFLTELRMNWPRLHRVLGHLYFAGIVLGSMTGFYMGTMAFGGPSAQLAFCLFSTLWLYTACRAIDAAIRHRIPEHRRWMTRNFVLTFSAVVVRVALACLLEVGFTFEQVYPFTSWCSWGLPALGLEIVYWSKMRRRRP